LSTSHDWNGAPDEARVAARRDKIRARLGRKFDPVSTERLVDFLIEPTGNPITDDMLDAEADMIINGEVDVDQLLGWMEAAAKADEAAGPEDGGSDA
jgi:hypothetical protein